MKTIAKAPLLVALLLSLTIVPMPGRAQDSAPAPQNQAKKPKKNAKAAQDGADIGQQSPLGEPLVYKTVDGKPLKLYVIKPAGWKAADKRPAIVFFHGGGWEIGRGAPTQFNYQGKYLASRGMVCIQVQYRLVANNRKEPPLGACQDAKSAMRWVRQHAAELGVDPDRIASGGGSAGGHLAALVGMVNGTDDPQDDLSVSCRPAAMVLYNPALLHGREMDRRPVESQSTTAVDALLQKYRQISPFYSVSRDAPPGIILVGSEDAILPLAEAKAFQEACKAVGVRMDLVVYPGEGHSFFGLRRSLARFFDTTVEMDKFLGSLGWLSGPPTLTRQQVQAYADEAVQSSKQPGGKQQPAK
jgi:acetyl esterase